jgi:multisubunit Na+/H+ antiporter MnhC subunit
MGEPVCEARLARVGLVLVPPVANATVIEMIVASAATPAVALSHIARASSCRPPSTT